ncbi:MAG: hypothetical protein EOM50_21095 [Erysipelotrichia bacterium]|nr:hypothetical protein [Erysipelotrichia bacterium]
MKVEIELEKNYVQNETHVIFNFTLDNTDTLVASERNTTLQEKVANFYFPLIFDLPHPDLCALAALKIISPYIGRELLMPEPVSEKMAQAIYKAYPNIKKINTSSMIKHRQKNITEKPAVSFSGGADSVAAASLLDSRERVPLIMLARKYHPNIGPFEQWYKTEANVHTMDNMPEIYKKIIVYSDFEFLSKSNNGNYCMYPDTYSFTIPSILLVEKLNLSHIVTGDIWVAFTGDETIWNKNLSYRRSYLFEAAGIPIDSTINGIGKLGSLLINDYYGLTTIVTTCQYGTFQNPCGKCIKCFRKCIYDAALFNNPLTKETIEQFNNSQAVKNFANNIGRNGYAFMPSYKYAFEKIDITFDDEVGKIQKKSQKMMTVVLRKKFRS